MAGLCRDPRCLVTWAAGASVAIRFQQDIVNRLKANQHAHDGYLAMVLQELTTLYKKHGAGIIENVSSYPRDGGTGLGTHYPLGIANTIEESLLFIYSNTAMV